MSNISRFFFLIIIFGLFSSSVFGDMTGYRTSNEFSEARFSIDVVDFRTEHDDVNRVEVYYKILYNGLTYQKTNSGYVADYQVSIVIEGKDDEQLEAKVIDGKVTLRTYAETRQADDYLVNMISTMYDPQNIKVRAALHDKDGNLIGEAETSLKKRKYWEKYATISRIQFASEITEKAKESKFNKGEFRVIPTVNRIFGGEIDSTIRFYHEVYTGTSQVKNMHLVTNMYLRNKGQRYTDTLEINDFSETIKRYHEINITDLKPGDYTLELVLIGRRGKEYNKYSESIELELTGESMFKNDYKEAVKMLKYLATKDEQNKLKKAETPEEQRRLWDEFWALRASDGINVLNPSRLEYFRRIRHANRYFGLMKKDGWKTTRGMIYIKYGAPDDVEDYPFELGVQPYQVWLYYRLSPPRKFVFVDEWGDGNYELQPPYNGF
ncbi:MAG: GWxTD domain-containing protein [candidate division Zixibacteria bacterium]|nr:GWxTD domain-containing protein [candidate division Zixibacteria bacterium]